MIASFILLSISCTKNKNTKSVPVYYLKYSFEREVPKRQENIVFDLIIYIVSIVIWQFPNLIMLYTCYDLSRRSRTSVVDL